MAIDISARFSFSLPEPTDILLQFEAAAIPEQVILEANTELSSAEHFARVPAQDGIGERIWLRADGEFSVSYSASVELHRQLLDLSTLAALEPHVLPGETVQYLLSSLYCPADRLQPFAQSEFEGLEGGPLVLAISDWISANIRYQSGTSTSLTSALDTFVERQGVCRDFAHVLITLARACGIPARYASVYAPRVDPQDFHAVAEVFLADPGGFGGAWHLVDATGMADPAEAVKIGVGRDAADVSFLTTFGRCTFGGSQVSVRRTAPALANANQT